MLFRCFIRKAILEHSLLKLQTLLIKCIDLNVDSYIFLFIVCTISTLRVLNAEHLTPTRSRVLKPHSMLTVKMYWF